MKVGELFCPGDEADTQVGGRWHAATVTAARGPLLSVQLPNGVTVQRYMRECRGRWPGQCVEKAEAPAA